MAKKGTGGSSTKKPRKASGGTEGTTRARTTKPKSVSASVDGALGGFILAAGQEDFLGPPESHEGVNYLRDIRIRRHTRPFKFRGQPHILVTVALKASSRPDRFARPEGTHAPSAAVHGWQDDQNPENSQRFGVTVHGALTGVEYTLHWLAIGSADPSAVTRPSDWPEEWPSEA